MDKWIDFSNIPKKKGTGKYKDRYVIDWKNCNNQTVNFKYGDIAGKIQIIRKYDENNILIKYNNAEYYIHHNSLEKCRLGRILKNTNNTKEKRKLQKEERLGLEKINNQGCLMKIIEYNSSKDITIEFQDKHNYKKKCKWIEFINGSIENPYYPSVFNVGIVGDSVIKDGNKKRKEYEAWYEIIKRSYSENLKNKRPTYKDVTCCKEWLYFDNFYKWIRSQENYDKWVNGNKWAVDKDIIKKGNKIYSPETCCLVSPQINSLFTKRQNYRGNLPIGVMLYNGKYCAQCNDGNGKSIHLGYFDNPIDAFYTYKKQKEKIIRDIAIKSFKDNEITKECYISMMNYEVDITD